MVEAPAPAGDSVKIGDQISPQGVVQAEAEGIAQPLTARDTASKRKATNTPEQSSSGSSNGSSIGSETPKPSPAKEQIQLPMDLKASRPADIPVEDAAGDSAKRVKSATGTPAAAPFRGAASSSPLSSLSVPVYPFGINPMARKDDTISSVFDYLDDWSNANQGERHISSVVDFLDSQVDVNERHLARLDEIRKLDEEWRSFTVRDRKTLPRDLKIFRHTWVDKCTEGVYKARLTCADVKPKGKTAAGDSALTNNFCPTPHKASAKLIELKSLLYNWPRAKADLSSAFLIARDGGDQDGQPTFLWPPKE